MLTLILALSALLSLPAHGGPSPAETRFLEAFQKRKAEVVGARTSADKTAAFERLRAFVAESEHQVREPDKKARIRLKFTIAGLRQYLDEINPSELAPAGCAAARQRIHFSADWRAEDVAGLAGEAREAVSLLDVLCKNF